MDRQQQRQAPPAAHDAVAGHIDWLDGLRGIAALWVFLSHAQILSGAPYVPVLSWGGLAVDLFMVLSGFLMMHHYLLRRAREPWGHPSTWGTFWIRRFFRIAPLYYLLLVVALAAGPWIGAHRDAIAAAWPSTATSALRYTDQSTTNVLLHASFAFGLLPQYSFRSPLPDWSIGLEMQFYAVFPFLALLFDRLGALRTGLLLMAACLALKLLFRDFFLAFEMPSLLAMKLYVFVIGMWIALGREAGPRGRLAGALVLSLLACATVFARDRSAESAGRIVLVLLLFYVMDGGSLPATAALRRSATAVRSALSVRLCRLAGDTSYGLYLVHLLVLIPLAGWLAAHGAYVQLPAAARFVLCAVPAGAAAYAIAWLLYRSVETGGIRAGKRLLGALRAHRGVASATRGPAK
ncbi:MAG TPA: acyltransferase [Burkholderiales bacterium]|nr:acyltransferase [Burkholderiales bacterium]